MPKKLVPVEIMGATICDVNDTRILLIAENTLIYVISFADQPEFKNFDLDEGAVVWAYYIPINRKVTGIIPFESKQVKEELPQAMPVEIDIAAKAARY